MPRYYKFQRGEAYRQREKVLGDILERIGANKKPEPEKPKMPLADAIQALQIHERARQGRLRAKFMWELSREDERRKAGAQVTIILQLLTRTSKLWRRVAHLHGTSFIEWLILWL